MARKHLGESYILGAHVTYANANHRGPWDCAEFATWAVYQATNMLLGCRPRRESASEAYTGYWLDDAREFGLEIGWREALNVPGAMVCRRAISKRIGHIAISTGDGATVVEAAGKNVGVREFSALGRPWDTGIRLPTAAEWVAISGGTVSELGTVLRASEIAGLPQSEVKELQTILRERGFDPGPIDGTFGAWTEQAVANFQSANGLVVDGIAGAQTLEALGLKFDGKISASAKTSKGTFNEKYGVTFASLVDGGFYSSDPDDTKVKRAIRTNNPGALNIRPWQMKRPGYVGHTAPDSSANKNRTTIFRTPEHGIASWYHLLVKRYEYGLAGQIRIGDLARRYAGVDKESDAAAQAYIAGWRRFSNNELSADSVIALDNEADTLRLARAMFGHEIGAASPLSQQQILYAIAHYRADDLQA